MMQIILTQEHDELLQHGVLHRNLIKSLSSGKNGKPLTEAEFARMSNLDVSTISRINTGKLKVSNRTVERTFRAIMDNLKDLNILGAFPDSLKQYTSFVRYLGYNEKDVTNIIEYFNEKNINIGNIQSMPIKVGAALPIAKSSPSLFIGNTTPQHAAFNILIEVSCINTKTDEYKNFSKAVIEPLLKKFAANSDLPFEEEKVSNLDYLVKFFGSLIEKNPNDAKESLTTLSEALKIYNKISELSPDLSNIKGAELVNQEKVRAK